MEWQFIPCNQPDKSFRPENIVIILAMHDTFQNNREPQQTEIFSDLGSFKITQEELQLVSGAPEVENEPQPPL